MLPNQQATPTNVNRRHLFSRCGIGLGSVALWNLLNRGQSVPASETRTGNPLAPRPPHFKARAKNVIFLFMAGGPSQLEMFENKPLLTKMSGQPIPESFVKGKRFAFMNSSHRSNLLGSKRSFRQHGESGAWVSDLLPATARIVDELTLVKTLKTEIFNHAPAKLFMNTGSGQFGRPSMGAWVTYGIGSDCDDLPGFVVLQSGPRGPRGGAVLWGSGFLPSAYQGVPLRSKGDPILNLSTPKSVTPQQQRDLIRALGELNLKHLVETGDDEIAARISAFEMAYRMQTSAPDLVDITGESQETLDLYGIKEPTEASFARNCLLARRLVERGVRFIQLYDTNWDHHGGPTETLEKHFPQKCQDVDQASAALVLDLKRRGLLDETIVVFGGEFGRTPMGEVRKFTGRNHHIDAFTMWLAGGGFKPGVVHGETDEFGFGAIKNQVHVHDLHATLLHQLGLDHERLTFRFQGRDFRLTDVHGHVVREILA